MSTGPSIVGETIWERGTYLSIRIEADESGADWSEIVKAVKAIARSAKGRAVAIVAQEFISPSEFGEFGNLQRISKTRDHWELSIRTTSAIFQTERLNSQRDSAPRTSAALLAQSGVSRERFFGAIGAWVNNELVRGSSASTRVNCEWVRKGEQFWLVQLDGEDEDLDGLNPHQFSIEPWQPPTDTTTSIVLQPTAKDIQYWDKLKVLDELADEESRHSPRLFFVPAETVLKQGSVSGFKKKLTSELKAVFGKNIVARTSLAAGIEKIINLPRTHCMKPTEAAKWCIQTAQKLENDYGSASKFAFIFHRFIDSRSCAWVRVDPNNPVAEIHGTWGLPDALQFCPYDIWEIHLTQQEITEYPEYKSHILLSSPDGKWRYERIRNDVARHQSISKQDIFELARRSNEIAKRLGRAVHIMWFVECVEIDGQKVNIPWYWTETHSTGEHEGRGNPRLFVVSKYKDLKEVASLKKNHPNLAIQLQPASPDLFRDNKFIKNVAQVALESSMPIYFSGSTLAHAYYLLQKSGCTVISTGDKGHVRSRRQVRFGKLVRDGIPAKIVSNKELAITVTAPPKSRTAFLIGKCIEELLEAREAEAIEDKKAELADILEVVRGLITAAELEFSEVALIADRKREKLGGFDAGAVLIETSLPTSQNNESLGESLGAPVSIVKQLDEETYEVPFNFFGFAELGNPVVLNLEKLGISVHVTLKLDSVEIRVVRNPSQLKFDL